MPPVAKTRMPARCAAIMVAATVVAPGRRVASAKARSARESFMTPVILASASSSSADSPTRISPSMMAIVAGTAPAARTTSSTPSAVATFSGQGMPWVTIVVSSATSGWPAAAAAAASGERRMRSKSAIAGSVLRERVS